MANVGPLAGDAGIDARAARTPARLGRGEGVARCVVGQCVRERDQSCGGFEVLQRYEPAREVVVAFSVRQNEATDVEDTAALGEDDLEKMRRNLWESRQPLRHRCDKLR